MYAHQDRSTDSNACFRAPRGSMINDPAAIKYVHECHKKGQMDKL